MHSSIGDILDLNIRENTGMRDKVWHNNVLHKAIVKIPIPSNSFQNHVSSIVFFPMVESKSCHLLISMF